MKKVFAFICALILALSLTACGNRQTFDFTYTFDEAIISMPDGSVVKGFCGLVEGLRGWRPDPGCY